MSRRPTSRPVCARRDNRALAALAAACVAALSGCAIDGYVWERSAVVQQVTIKMTEVQDVAPLCAPYLPGVKVMACAVWRVGYCEIIVPPNAPALVAHEAAHCLGFMHPNERKVVSGAYVP